MEEVITGEPDPRHISTSFVEPSNLTLRMLIRRFTRWTNGFSKKVENHAAMVSLFFMYYNFGRVHQTLRVTPAMEAGSRIMCGPSMKSSDCWSKRHMMKQFATISIVVALALAFLSRLSAQNRVPAFYGDGRHKCAVWWVDGRPRNGIANDARASPAGNQNYTQWVDGFISGVAYASPEPIAQASSDAIVGHFLHDYCQAHPLDTFETAAKALIVELKKR